MGILQFWATGYYWTIISTTLHSVFRVSQYEIPGLLAHAKHNYTD